MRITKKVTIQADHDGLVAALSEMTGADTSIRINDFVSVRRFDDGVFDIEDDAGFHSDEDKNTPEEAAMLIYDLLGFEHFTNIGEANAIQE